LETVANGHVHNLDIESTLSLIQLSSSTLQTHDIACLNPFSYHSSQESVATLLIMIVPKTFESFAKLLMRAFLLVMLRK
jgi:hypothetical protein